MGRAGQLKKTLDISESAVLKMMEVRDIVQLGEQYRHAHPTDSPKPSMNFVSRDLDRAFSLTFQTGPVEKSLPFNAPVSGLHPARIYNAVEINLPEVDSTPRLAADAIRPKPARTGWPKASRSFSPALAIAPQSCSIPKATPLQTSRAEMPLMLWIKSSS